MVEGEWLERLRGRSAGPRDYCIGERGAAYTHLVLASDVGVHRKGEGEYTLTMHEDVRVCAAWQDMALALDA